MCSSSNWLIAKPDLLASIVRQSRGEPLQTGCLPLHQSVLPRPAGYQAHEVCCYTGAVRATAADRMGTEELVGLSLADLGMPHVAKVIADRRTV